MERLVISGVAIFLFGLVCFGSRSTSVATRSSAEDNDNNDLSSGHAHKKPPPLLKAQFSENSLRFDSEKNEKRRTEAAVTVSDSSEMQLDGSLEGFTISDDDEKTLSDQTGPEGDDSVPTDHDIDDSEAGSSWDDSRDFRASQEEDWCDLNNARCTPFLGSPCNDYHKVPGTYYSGRCPITERQARKFWRSCGNEFTAHDGNRSACYCNERARAASCCGGLTSIPDLNHDNFTVLYLNFTSNDLCRLDVEVLGKYGQLRWLIVNRNNVSHVTRDALHHMTSLEQLELAHNDADRCIDAATFTSALNARNASLRVLALNFTRFSTPLPRAARGGGERGKWGRKSEGRRREWKAGGRGGERGENVGEEERESGQRQGLPPAKRDVPPASLIRHLKLPKLAQLYADGGSRRKFHLSDTLHLPSLCKLSLTCNRLETLYCCSSASKTQSFSDGDDDEDDNYYYYKHHRNDNVDDHDNSHYNKKGDDRGTNVRQQKNPTDNSDPFDVGAAYDGDGEEMETCISPRSRHDQFCLDFHLPNLRLLDLANNSFLRVPSVCVTSNRSAVHGLQRLSLSINALLEPKPDHFRCLDSLLSLAMTGNPLRRLEEGLLREMTKLHDLDLRFTNVMQAKPGALGHPSLRALTIKFSNWFIDHHHEACCISFQLFKGSAILDADLSYNVLRYAKSKNVDDFLFPLRTVRKLGLAGVGLDHIPRVIANTFTNLEYLDFQDNFLNAIPIDSLLRMDQLRYLDLKWNYLASPRADMLEKLMTEHSVKVDLANNPFSCTCDLLAFLQLYRATRIRGSHAPASRTFPARFYPAKSAGGLVRGSYRCNAPPSLRQTPLDEVQMTVHTCLLTVLQEILIYFIVIFFTFCFLVYALLYKYRWQVRFWLYSLHMRLSRRDREDRGRNRARYTAFVSYCREDSHFVLSKALPALERTHRLALCIHERDFVPGKYISQNVLELMECSQHVLLVLSNNALRSDWWRFELFAAQRLALGLRRVPVTALVLEPLRVDLMDAQVLALLQASPRIDWPGEWGPEGPGGRGDGGRERRRATRWGGGRGGGGGRAGGDGAPRGREDTDSNVENFWRRLGKSLGSNVR